MRVSTSLVQYQELFHICLIKKKKQGQRKRIIDLLFRNSKIINFKYLEEVTFMGIVSFPSKPGKIFFFNFFEQNE